MTPLTVVTPTWNRRHLLPRLYRSLAAEAIAPTRFDWLVVDDGSTDGTAAYVEELAREAPFPIRLITQPHGGKHRALNRAFAQVATDWVLVLDSDDWILPGGLAAALSDIQAVDDSPAIAAIVSPRVFADRPPLVYPDLAGPIGYATWREKYFKSDFSMVARTSRLAAYPFPEFDGEDFVAESAVYARAFARGGLVLKNTRIMGAEYQRDGLSTKMRVNRATSPRGAMFTYRCQLEAGLTGMMRARAWANYHRYAHHDAAREAAAREAPPPGPRGIGGALWRPVGWALYRNDMRLLRRRPDAD